MVDIYQATRRQGKYPPLATLVYTKPVGWNICKNWLKQLLFLKFVSKMYTSLE